MVSMQPHLSQLGSGLIWGLKALLFVQKGEGAVEVSVRYHSGGSMKLNTCNLLNGNMVYL